MPACAWSFAIALLLCEVRPPARRWPPAQVLRYSCPDPKTDLDDWIPPDERLRADPTQQVLQALAGGPLSPSELAKALQCRATAASMRLARMQSRGLVARIEAGRWIALSPASTIPPHRDETTPGQTGSHAATACAT